MENIINQVIGQWVNFKNENKDLTTYGIKRGNQFVMGSIELGDMVIIELECEN